MIAGLLHDLIEDTDYKVEEIEKEFGERVVELVSACTFDRSIKDYKQRWRELILNIKQTGWSRCAYNQTDRPNGESAVLYVDFRREKETRNDVEAQVFY